MNIIKSKYNPIHGFAGNASKTGDEITLIHTGFFTSDNKNFYTYIRQIEKHFNLPGDFVFNFLIVLKEGGECLIYPNIGQFTMSVAHKKSYIEKGEAIYDKDIRGYEKIDLSAFDISPSDGIIFCFKVKRKYGLYFNFSPLLDKEKYKLNIKDLEKVLGKSYTFLWFDEEVDYINNKLVYENLVNDGRFPFFELLPHEYRKLYSYYENSFDIVELHRDLLQSFSKDRISKLQEKRYTNEFFREKKDLIDAGIDAYFQGNKGGYINCLKTLCTEIEGLIGLFYMGKTNKQKFRTKDIVEYLQIYMNNSKQSHLLTMGFNEKFVEYLLHGPFGHFDLEAGEISTSKHTVSHGLAKKEEYSQIKCLQYILILDQLYYYFIEKI